MTDHAATIGIDTRSLLTQSSGPAAKDNADKLDSNGNKDALTGRRKEARRRQQQNGQQ